MLAAGHNPGKYEKGVITMLNPKTGQEVTGTPGYKIAESFETLKKKYSDKIVSLDEFDEINEHEAVEIERNGSSSTHLDCQWYSAKLILLPEEGDDPCDEFSFYVKRNIEQ